MALIHEKLCAVMKEIDPIGKEKRNTEQNFNYRGIDDFYNQLHVLCKKHEIFSLTEVLKEATEERQTKSGKTMIYRILTTRFSFVAKDGSRESSIIQSEGADMGDKGSNKALASGHKYFLMQLFLFPTDDLADPDGETPEPAYKHTAAAEDNKSYESSNKSSTEATGPTGGTFKADATAALKASALPAVEKDSLLKQLESKPANLQKAFYEGCILPRIKKAGNKAQPAADQDEGIPFETFAEQESLKKAEPKKAAAPEAEKTVGRQFDDDPIGLY